ncbi:diaminopimelate epimerase [Galbibacter sp. EGI 63066]|uniref:diaminopimelate epimerase n=1 Tax=Galbibacter sp. EGI 63066 TaxID=2993559 RepID=UPI002248F130|nr:diaminopimelate epimerase [Galbibacter sp. EGI 63066]MCX2681342.1 diaminopimelate epimerase [Galbibacter sp. EGI 63066]
MKLNFYKYQGTGNDFVMIDNRQQFFPKNNIKLVNNLCDRRFGIGADGLILLENGDEADFKMVYYNADGNESTMCGNGGRCIVAFANFLNVVEDECTFMAVDGLHHASISEGIISLAMQNVESINAFANHVFLDTGSPHHVQLVNGLSALDVKNHGAKLRYGKYGNEGSNINFVEKEEADTFSVRTYERGVEDETFSCGTGVTAVALAMHHTQQTDSNQINLKTPGGLLKVSFEKNGVGYKNIHLVGPATQVFSGIIEI